MSAYRKCEICGANLDPGEQCDCMNNLPAIQCTQPPVITENLERITQNLQVLLTDISTLPKDDESLKYVKKVRASLAKELDRMETQRKAAKRKALEPYEQAEVKYKQYISNPYREADAQLKEWVDSYQNGLKQKCEDYLREYFDEMCRAYDIDFIRFEDLGLTIDMVTARQKEPRRAMDTIREQLTSIRDDMDMILRMENAAQVMAEFRKKPILAAAMMTVGNRMKEQEQMQAFVAERQERLAAQEQEMEMLLEAAPELQEEQEPHYTVAFKATGSIAALKAMKAYAISLGITFEEIQEEENNE